MSQPIIRGIQAVGAVDILYQYNSPDCKLTLNSAVMSLGSKTGTISIDTIGGIPVSGFRLDGEFLRAVQQIASSVQVPILGGGAVALTNNNRSGTLNINCTKVSTPDPKSTTGVGQMYRPTGQAIGPNADGVYDLAFLAQVQQSQPGGDSVGATLKVVFAFCGLYTTISFEGCTIASVDPIGLAGNDAPNYNVSINYLNWTVACSRESSAPDNSLTQWKAKSGS